MRLDPVQGLPSGRKGTWRYLGWRDFGFEGWDGVEAWWGERWFV